MVRRTWLKLGMSIAVMLAAGWTTIATPAVAADVPAFCTAYATLQEDPTDADVIRAQAARMTKAKPPKAVVKALAVIRAAAAGERAAGTPAVVAATSRISRFAGARCSTSATGSEGRATSRRCPLTAERVTAAVGSPVEDTGSCTFFPAGGASPRIALVRPGTGACQGANPDALGFNESLDGLGVKAYVRRSGDVAAILACPADPFDLLVEIPGDGAAALTAAERLATEVLAGT